VRLTVLGKSPAWEDADGACSAYLVEEGSHRLLIDCGNGSFAKLRSRIGYRELDAVLISHIHADHILDLVPLGYALTLGPPEGEPRLRPDLHLPPGGLASLRELVAVWGSDGLIDDAFRPIEYERGGGLEIGPISVALHEVPHFALTHAVELRAPSGRRVVYGADCRAGPEIEAAAAGADLLLAEATLSETQPESDPIERRGHMSAAEAGTVAAAAGVERLVLTHISDQIDTESALAAAAASFGGEVEIAAEGSTWEL
jgi:ribonuclease BN (tRNA processing enzyme)